MDIAPQSDMDALLWDMLGDTLDDVMDGKALDLSDRLLIKSFRLYQHASTAPHTCLRTLSDCYFAVSDASIEVVCDKLDDPRHAYDFD